MFSSLSSFADNIRDFQIEGMSIGDSALDYFSEEELKNANVEGYKDKKFLMLGIWKEYKLYDVLQIYVKPNDSKYKMYAIAGVIIYSDNLESCKTSYNLTYLQILKIKKKKIMVE